MDENPRTRNLQRWSSCHSNGTDRKKADAGLEETNVALEGHVIALEQSQKHSNAKLDLEIAMRDMFSSII